MAAPGENLKINGDRLWDSLMEMAKIGPGVAGGPWEDEVRLPRRRRPWPP